MSARERSTADLIAVYENDDGDDGDEALEILHERALRGDPEAAVVLNGDCHCVVCRFTR